MKLLSDKQMGHTNCVKSSFFAFLPKFLHNWLSFFSVRAAENLGKFLTTKRQKLTQKTQKMGVLWKCTKESFQVSHLDFREKATKNTKLGKKQKGKRLQRVRLNAIFSKNFFLWLFFNYSANFQFFRNFTKTKPETQKERMKIFLKNAFWKKAEARAMLLVTAKQIWLNFDSFSNISKTTEWVKNFERKTSGNGICFRPCPQGTSKIGRLWQIQTINIVIQTAKPTMFKSTSQKNNQNFRFTRWREMWSQYLWKKMTCKNDKISRTSAFCSAFLLNEDYNTRNKT